MGRTQTFVTDDVVRRARTVFWEHGYGDASLPALEQATGLSRSSLYHAFGSKRGLFDAAVASYLDEVVRPRLHPLTVDDVRPDAVLEYLDGLRRAVAQVDSVVAQSGCLLLNAATAPIAHDEAVRQAVAAYRAELHRGLGAGVRALLPGLPDDESERLATVCTSAVVTAFTLARIDTDSALASIDAATGLLTARAREGRAA